MKKGAAVVTGETVIIIVMIIAAILAGGFFIAYIYNSPQKLAAVAGDIESPYVNPEIAETKEQLIADKKDKLEKNPDVKKIFDDLFDVFNSSGKGGPCYEIYRTSNNAYLPDLKGFSIRIITLDDQMGIVLHDESGIPLVSRTVRNLKPCVVAGSDASKDVHKNFYDNYLDGSKGSKSPEIIESDILLKGKTRIQAGGMEYALADYGVMYKKDDKHLCFIPTGGLEPWVCGTGDYAIDYPCADQLRKGEIKNLPKCG